MRAGNIALYLGKVHETVGNWKGYCSDHHFCIIQKTFEESMS